MGVPPRADVRETPDQERGEPESEPTQQDVPVGRERTELEHPWAADRQEEREEKQEERH